jgi:hypothetical protein
MSVLELKPEKRRRGAPFGNQNPWKQGEHAAKAALRRFGQRAINKRTRSGREWKFIYVSWLSKATKVSEASLTTAEAIRAAEKRLDRGDRLFIEAMASDGWMARTLDTAIVQLPSIVRRDKTLVPLIAERDARLRAYESRCEEFRRRFEKAPTLEDVIARVRHEAAAAQQTPPTTQKPFTPASTQPGATERGETAAGTYSETETGRDPDEDDDGIIWRTRDH